MDVERQRSWFLTRTRQYLHLGYDRVRAAEFVAEFGGALEGPVLDVGTGKGLLAMALARRGLEVVSVDVSAEDRMLAALLAKEHGLSDRIHFVRADAKILPFPNACFGTCAMMDVLHHLDDGTSVLSEMVRVLKPGGALLAADFSDEGLSLVARVHAAEGRVHPVGSVTMSWADDFLAGLELERTASTEEQLHRVVLFRNTEAQRCESWPPATRKGGRA